jgi:hypothetical protein
LVCAYEAVRISEARAFTLDDWDGRELNIAKGVQGRRIDAPVKVNKTRSAVRREPAIPELREWIEWRAAQATAAARLRGEALFSNPTADNPTKRWAVSALNREWRAACEAAGVAYVPLGRGTRHASLTAIARSGASERFLRAHGPAPRRPEPRPLREARRGTARGDRPGAAARKTLTRPCGRGPLNQGRLGAPSGRSVVVEGFDSRRLHKSHRS